MNNVVIGEVVFWVTNLKHVSTDLNVSKLEKQHIKEMLKLIVSMCWMKQEENENEKYKFL